VFQDEFHLSLVLISEEVDGIPFLMLPCPERYQRHAQVSSGWTEIGPTPPNIRTNPKKLPKRKNERLY